jgi:solute carrier family 39 (zinc transporter), member 1/2/3
MFSNKCLGELAYESTAAAIFMAGLFLSFLVEYAGLRVVKSRQSRSSDTSTSSVECSVSESMNMRNAEVEKIGAYVMEAGVIFHSLRKCLQRISHIDYC